MAPELALASLRRTARSPSRHACSKRSACCAGGAGSSCVQCTVAALLPRCFAAGRGAGLAAGPRHSQMIEQVAKPQLDALIAPPARANNGGFLPRLVSLAR